MISQREIGVISGPQLSAIINQLAKSPWKSPCSYAFPMDFSIGLAPRLVLHLMKHRAQGPRGPAIPSATFDASDARVWR